MLLPFKIAKTHPRYLNADVRILSIGKSGRTWLRTLVNKYLSLKYGLTFDIKDMHAQDPSLPSIVYAHEMWMHYSEASFTQRLKQKHIIPDRILKEGKAVLLSRDPRDVVVSLYFQVTKRSSKTRESIDMPIGEFIRHPRLGINNIVLVLNAWRERLRRHPNSILLRYEDLKSDTTSELERLLSFCGIGEVDKGIVQEAVDFSAFENMKKMEAQGRFNEKALKPGDPSDPSSFKVREGKVGGYTKHFTKDELGYLDKAVRKLDGFFKYPTSASGKTEILTKEPLRSLSPSPER